MGQYHIWNNQGDLGELGIKFAQKPQSYMCQNLKDQFIQQANPKMDSESKLVFFKNAKETFNVSKYLSTIKNRESRSLFSKLRLDILPLEIELGRRKGLAREERFCKFFNGNRIEDEVHFIFECPSFENLRAQALNSISVTTPTLSHIDNIQKLNFLFYNEHTPTKALETAAKMLANLMHARDALK